MYNRRFEIYSKSLSFYQALLRIPSRDATGDERDRFNVTQNEFIKARLESQFLFAAKSGVYELLDEMNTRSFRMIGWKDIVCQTLLPDSKEWRDSFNQDREDSEWANGFIPKLGSVMVGYLDFGNIR